VTSADRPSPEPTQSAAWLETAHLLADAAGKTVLPYFRKRLVVENKAAAVHAGVGFDPVTIADVEAEQAMRKILAVRHADHGVIGEEFADHAGAGRFNWILDPIDGTRAFIMGYPMWGVLIGLLDGQTPAFGMMDQPYTRERFWAVADGKLPKAAFFRGPDGNIERLHTRPCARLADATLACTTLEMMQTRHEQAAFAEIAAAVRMTRLGGDCYAYAMLAAGQVDLVVEASLKAVDIAPLIPIIEAAGGVVTGWDGGPATAGGQVVAAGDPRMHAAALRILGNTRSDVMSV
jgi:histidinol phosphatase-like enzyme (inositol monophosphatase family)